MNPRAVGSAPGQDLNLLLAGGSALGLGDGPLIDRFVTGPGPVAEAAFEALIQRHGPMVARVCGGILGNHHTAEDAVQAVFLVLARRARSIRDPDRLAPWLYGVALRTAREARRRSPARSSTLEEAPMIDPALDPTQTSIRREQADLLYGAIARLPGRYLAPVVLCDLEGLTHTEAAAQLNCPAATVSIRLKRAREKLRSTLARHRLDFESAWPVLTTITALPRTLVATTAAQVLANRVAWTTSAAPWKAAFVAALVVAGLAAVGAQGNPQDPPPPKPPGATVAEPPVERQDPPEPKATPAPVVPAPEVKIGFPTVRDVMDFEQYIGHVAASRTVEIRPQVSGVVLDVKVAEGDLVHANQGLFKVAIKTKPDGASLAIRIEEIRSKLAQLGEAKEKINRDTKNSGDPAERRVRDQMAKMTEELGALESQGPLIRAPFDGLLVRPLVDVGATVEEGKTPLATIIAVDPILVDFRISERTYFKIQQWMRSRPGLTHLPVRVALINENGFPHPGRVRFQVTRFDESTGTCTLHAELPNPDRALIPGLSAQVRVEYGDPHSAILVPEAATTEAMLPSERFVLVVDDAGVARRRQVEVGLSYDGLREVKSGIDAKTRVILGGTRRVRPGEKVEPPAETPPK